MPYVAPLMVELTKEHFDAWCKLYDRTEFHEPEPGLMVTYSVTFFRPDVTGNEYEGECTVEAVSRPDGTYALKIQFD